MRRRAWSTSARRARRHDPRHRPEVRRIDRAAARWCRTLLWNGPLGAFEIEPFDQGTNAVARRAAELTQAGKLRTVAGSGDTVAALAHAGVLERFSYVSTAGEAFLEWLEGKDLQAWRPWRAAERRPHRPGARPAPSAGPCSTSPGRAAPTRPW